MRHWLSIALLATALGCEGEFKSGDSTPLMDVGMPPIDLGMPDEGMPEDHACAFVTCGTNAECVDGECWCSPGFMGDPATGCTPGNPCADANCTFGSTCHADGVCTCDIGFEENLTYCEFAEVSDPETRTEAEVCARWNADYPEHAGPRWSVEPATECDPGVLHPEYQLDAVRRITLYRWLVGLAGVTTTADYMERTQACATTLAAHNIGATNTITSDFTCFSEAAESGALGSSILRNAPSAAAAVDTFLEDAAAPNLGNRRWILNPRMGATALGHAGAYTCMYAVDRNATGAVPFFGYPMGTFPIEALRGRWMWASTEHRANLRTRVALLDPNGEALPIANVVEMADNIDLPSGLVWEVPNITPGAYTVQIKGLVGEVEELEYVVNLVACE